MVMKKTAILISAVLLVIAHPVLLFAQNVTLEYSTYLGGTAAGEYGYAIDVDTAGSAYITGQINSYDFPTANPYQSSFAGTFDAFASKLSSTGSALIYSTYLGGSQADRGYGIAVDASASAYITGST